jgi:hypothetical protein
MEIFHFPALNHCSTIAPHTNITLTKQHIIKSLVFQLAGRGLRKLAISLNTACLFIVLMSTIGVMGCCGKYSYCAFSFIHSFFIYIP